MISRDLYAAAKVATKQPVGSGGTKANGQGTRAPSLQRATWQELQRVLGNQAVQRLLRSGVIQATLHVSHPDDPYEQEADRVADEVMRLPEPPAGTGLESPGTRIVRPRWRANSASSSPAPIQCESVTDESENREPEEVVAQAKLQGRPGSSPDLADRVSRLRGRGQPIPELLRSFFERRLGYDLGAVRLHVDPDTGALAQELKARAFTVGHDIVFGPGEYDPESRQGRQLMAHELVHTLQQHSGSQRSAGSDLPGNRRAAVCSRSAGMWQRAQTGRPASTSPFFTYELDSVVPSFDRLAAHYGTTARAIRQANPGVREAAGVSVQVPAMHLPAAAPGSLGGTGRAGVVVRGTASPVDIRWNSDADANRIGRLSRGDQLPEIFAPTGNGFFSVLIDPGSLQQRADGILDELRALGRVAGPGSPGNFVLGFVPAANVVEARFGQSRATQALAVAYAEYQQGVSEDPPCTNRGPAVDKYTGVSGASPVIAGNRVTRGRCGLAWCAFFVRWCLRQVGVSNAIGGAAVSVKNWGQGNGWFLPTPPATPAVGDVFFKQPSGSTGHPCDTNPCVSRGPGTGHVGFILGVGTGSVTTVEGNIHAPGELNDGVRSLSRPISDLEGVVRIP